MMLCGLSSGPDFPDAGSGMCCGGAAMFGPERCTCWEAVYDLEQQEPRTDLARVERSEQCVDCAYRTDSTERRGEEHVVGDDDELERLVRQGLPFVCHQGIRRPVRWEHRPQDCTPQDCDELNPDRVTVVPGDSVNYSPPIVGAIPYKADGTPADICAGWAARRRVLAETER